MTKENEMTGNRSVTCYCRTSPRCLAEHRLCLCRCGHRLGAHLNDRRTASPCMHGHDHDDTADPCECPAFYPADARAEEVRIALLEALDAWEHRIGLGADAFDPENNAEDRARIAELRKLLVTT